MDKDNIISPKLLELMKKTGYEIVQHNGQRKFGPPPNWTGPPPPKGCEVFIGKLPRDVYEDELVPLFSQVGKIYELRMMMDFSGSNRGYAFVNYSKRAEAYAAIRQLNGYQIRPGRYLGVVKSVDNCRLFVGNIPRTKTEQEVLDELSKLVSGIVDIILYKNHYDRTTNRRFAFVEFTSHRAAAMARRALIPGSVKLWGQEVNVDWAEPQPDVDDEHMQHVKILYVRNFEIRTTPETIKTIFENAINTKIESVKKINDYAFIHFYKRAHAELAISRLQNADVDGSNIEIVWAKPVHRELYKIQKQCKGNAKFNNSFDFKQTLLIYKQHLEKKEYEKGLKDQSNQSGCALPSASCSPIKITASMPTTSDIALLDSMCKTFMWPLPTYNFQKYVDGAGADWWTCTMELPYVGLPLNIHTNVGPFTTRACSSLQQAHIEAAQVLLHVLRMIQVDMLQHTVAPQSLYPSVASIPNSMTLPHDYNLYQGSPVPVPAVWHKI